MKAIMISIRPEWVEKILNGEKTIEIRKSMPKCELPIKVYIYCTKCKDTKMYTDEVDIPLTTRMWMGNGKVVAEFTLNEIETLWQNHKDGASTACIVDKQIFERLSCMTWEQYCEYHKCKNGKYSNSYAWHIDDLKIYDEPKELGEFRTTLDRPRCGYSSCGSYEYPYCKWLFLNCEKRIINTPPQSWFYCEELEENNE